MNYKYLSEEALEKLIADTEQNGLIKAPGRIQNNVWKQIDRHGATDVTGLGAFGKNRHLQLAVYSLKVGLAAAAAIFMLFRMEGLQQSEGQWHIWQPEDGIHTENSSMREEDRTEIKNGADVLHTTWSQVSDWFGTILEPQKADTRSGNDQWNGGTY